MSKYIYTVPEMSEVEKRDFVMECEESFESQLRNAAHKLLEANSRIITLSGPTCSGKTTTASRFISEFEDSGRRIGVISIDDFYKSREVLHKESAERGLLKVDYDSALSIDLEYFEECIDGIMDKKTIMLPRYSFEKGIRNGYFEFDSSMYDHIILEGIQAVYPEVTSHIHCGFKSVQISVAHDVEVNGQFFTSRQIRFLRRMIRDARTRNAPPEVTFDMWKGVSHNEDIYILPFDGQYDITLNSFMKYEPFMTKRDVNRLLKDIDIGHDFYHKAEEIKDKIEDFFEISVDYLPERSVYREFLG